MTLQQLSVQYAQEAQVLRGRIRTLQQEQADCTDPESLDHLRQRIRELVPLQRQSHQLAELTAHYYDRGYRRNEQYTL